jgi:FkbM family methyltransferase
MNFFYEDGRSIDISQHERDEQDHARYAIRPDSVVLELGARYGVVSCVINKILNNPKNQVSVEPDPRVWDILEKNRDTNGCTFEIVRGLISKVPVRLSFDLMPSGLATKAVPSGGHINAETFTLEEIQAKYGLKFDTLVADCEGGLGPFFEENPWMYDQLRTVLYEADCPEACDYGLIQRNLQSHGFQNVVYGDRFIWFKP